MVKEFLVCDLYFNPNVCHTCKIYNSSLKTCQGCHLISYCGINCQKLHWKSHKNLCRLVKNHIGYDYYSKFVNLENSITCPELKKDIEKSSCNVQLQIRKDEEMVNKFEQFGLGSNVHSQSNRIPEMISETCNEIIQKDVEFQNSDKAAKQNVIRADLPSEILKQRWNEYKFTLFCTLEKLINRAFRNIEKEILLNPKACSICKTTKALKLCEICLTVSYCGLHKAKDQHEHCSEYFLAYEISRHVVFKYLSNSFKYIETISNFLEPFKFENELDSYELSEYLSYYKTLNHLISRFELSRERQLKVHVVGASEFECSPYSVYLWENALHCNDTIFDLELTFIGFNVVNDKFEMKLCEQCLTKQKKLKIEIVQMSYHEFINNNYSKPQNAQLDSCIQKGHNFGLESMGKNSKLQLEVSVDFILAYNAGFHEMEKEENNPWTKTLIYFLNLVNIPIAFTSYTEQEMCIDSGIIKQLAEKFHIDVTFLINCEINDQASEKPRIDPEGGVYYSNKYMSCFITQ